MSEVKVRATLIGDQGQYTKVDDMVFPNPHSEKMSDLEWRLRYAPDSIGRGDQLYLASIVDSYREIVIRKTAKDRNHVCSAIKFTGAIPNHRLDSEGSGKA